MKNTFDYTEMQKKYYDLVAPTMAEGNHQEHNSNPDYWDVLLSPLNNGDWSNKVALDFGCGCGRNVLNILDKFNIKECHGCDISSENIFYCNEILKNTQHKNYYFFVSDGQSLSPAEDGQYDLIISTIVLEHICVYSIRKKILSDMFRCLKEDGIISFQMGFGSGLNSADYYTENTEATGTNGAFNVRVDNEEEIIKDLDEIGFKNIKTQIKNPWPNADFHEKWIYVTAVK